MSDIASAWGGGATRNLRDYYRGGAFVPNNWYNTGHIPTSGEIRMGHFTNQFGLAPNDDVLYGKEARIESIVDKFFAVNGNKYEGSVPNSAYAYPASIKYPLNYWLKTSSGSGTRYSDSTGWFPPQYQGVPSDGNAGFYDVPIYHHKDSNIENDAAGVWGQSRKNFGGKTIPNGVLVPDQSFSNWCSLIFVGNNHYPPGAWYFGLESGGEIGVSPQISNITTAGGNVFSLFHVNQPIKNILYHRSTLARVAANGYGAYNYYVLLPGRWYVTTDVSLTSPIYNTSIGATYAGYYDYTTPLPAYSVTFISTLQTNSGNARKLYLDNFQPNFNLPGLSGWGYDDTLYNIELLKGQGYSLDMYPFNYWFGFSGAYYFLMNMRPQSSTGRIYRSAYLLNDPKNGPYAVPNTQAGLDSFGTYFRLTTLQYSRS